MYLKKVTYKFFFEEINILLINFNFSKISHYKIKIKANKFLLIKLQITYYVFVIGFLDFEMLC